MKKFNLFIIIIFIFIAFASPSFSKSDISLPVYKTDYYSYNLETLTYKIYPNAKHINKTEYKKYLKISKLYKKGKYHTIEIKYPDFYPILFTLYEKESSNNNHNNAIRYLTKLQQKQPEFYPDFINFFLYEEYYASKQYQKALAALSKINNLVYFDTYYHLAKCYFNLENYYFTELYATKVNKFSKYYYKSLELQFRALYRQKKMKEAEKIARLLIDQNPKYAGNYLRLALCVNDFDTKLSLLYKSRNMATNTGPKLTINSFIASLEQLRIDKYFEGYKGYIDKPNWSEIASMTKYGSLSYWINRQDNYFKSINDCLRLYIDNDLVACLSTIRNKQVDLNQFLLQETQVENEQRYQLQALRQNERMIMEQQLHNMQMQMQLYNINNNLMDINRSIRRY